MIIRSCIRELNCVCTVKINVIKHLCTKLKQCNKSSNVSYSTFDIKLEQGIWPISSNLSPLQFFKHINFWVTTSKYNVVYSSV